MTVLGIIPARGNSKSIPRKNLVPVAGRPLIAYTIDVAQNSGCLARSVVSTEDPEIGEVARSLGCGVVERPAELAADDTPTLPVVKHAVEWLSLHEEYSPDVVVVLQPTAPLREATDIVECVRILADSGADSVVSVAEVPRHFHPTWQTVVDDGRLVQFDCTPLKTVATQRQVLAPTYYRNGAVYALWLRTLQESNSLYGDVVAAYVMPAERSINIDSPADLILAEKLLGQRQVPGPGGQHRALTE